MSKGKIKPTQVRMTLANTRKLITITSKTQRSLAKEANLAVDQYRPKAIFTDKRQIGL